MAGDGCMIPEDFVFHYRLARVHGAEEVCQMVGGIIITRRSRVCFHLSRVVQAAATDARYSSRRNTASSPRRSIRSKNSPQVAGVYLAAPR